MVLGDIDFVERLIGYVKKSKDIIEIPRNQRYVSRPSHRELFRDKRKRNARIAEAVYECGYSQREVADHLEIHYSTISRLLKSRERSWIVKSKDLTPFFVIIVSNLGSLYPTIRFRYTSIRTGHVSESQTRGYQADFAYLFSKPVKGFQDFTVRDAMKLDPMDIFKSHLRKVENNPHVVTKAIKI